MVSQMAAKCSMPTAACLTSRWFITNSAGTHVVDESLDGPAQGTHSAPLAQEVLIDVIWFERFRSRSRSILNGGILGALSPVVSRAGEPSTAKP